MTRHLSICALLDVILDVHAAAQGTYAARRVHPER